VTADRLLDALHADKPLRVWSLIVTIFGDVVMRQGRDPAPGPIWTGHLLALLETLGVEPGLVRTSLSRLVSSGVLIRAKTGRNTFYRLGDDSAAAFAAAAETIYGRKTAQPLGPLHLCVIDRASDRKAAREALEAQGVRFLSPGAGLKPAHRDEPPLILPDGVIAALAAAEGEAAAAARDLWRVDELQRAYRDFLARFADLAPSTDPENAILARVILVHRMRRIVLRDPVLPLAVLPPDWAGNAARALFDRLLAALEEPSEQWLAEQGFRSGVTD
jgi:phenylacetic acid degradation operon negative regulatory protein